jgi:hypothetical protein
VRFCKRLQLNDGSILKTHATKTTGRSYFSRFKFAVKTQTQAQFLPELKRIVGEEMDKAVLKLKPQDSTSNSFKAGG